MKIIISWSVEFANEIKKLASELESLGLEVILPPTTEKILRGEISAEEVKKEKENMNFAEMTIKNDAIRRFADLIKSSDAILISNFGKHGIKDYIWWWSFLEIGFAHVFHKKIFILNWLPEMRYVDEIVAMQPILLHGDVHKIMDHIS
jgi:hypothetical protein